MSHITTFTKKHFDPTAPEMELICIEDIAHALSMLTRAGGHFNTFYSVAQHSINCMLEAKAKGCSDKVQLACLLHDASEAYLSDITRPVKAVLDKYLEIEGNMQITIYTKWLLSPLTEDELRQISEVDDTLLYYEFRHFMGEELFDCPPTLSLKPDFDFADFPIIENSFLRMFNRFF
ncbi:MAG: HD domain-containing protein, partial [Clostridiales bacterium]|nr:HD domain-containing protein [Clostridiales bacterium]